MVFLLHDAKVNLQEKAQKFQILMRICIYSRVAHRYLPFQSIRNVPNPPSGWYDYKSLLAVPKARG